MSATTLRCATLAVALSACATHASAAAADYRFEVASADPAGRAETAVTIRLIRIADGKPVQDAVIFETHADMGPAGMATMPADVTPVAAQPDGTYRFQVGTTMAGTWALTLSAKVQGEPQTVKGSVTFKAEK